MSVLCLLALLALPAPVVRPEVPRADRREPPTGDSAPPCRLLSLSGGGSWGAFEAGVLQRLIVERGEGFDYERILGVSAGSLNAALLATEAPGHAGLLAGSATLRKLWTDARTRDVWRFKPLSLDERADKSLLSNAPLGELLGRALAGRTIRRNLTVGLTSLATGRPVVVDEAEIARAGGAQLVPLLLASSAIPVLFPPVHYNRTLFVDGGIGSNVLTVHGVERCPNVPVQLDIINCLPLIGQLALRSMQVLLETAFDHQLSFKCAPGERSNVLARIYSPRQGLGIVVPTVLDFDFGARLWQAGYEQSAAPDEFYFCV
ncbi:hypothetical protein KFE25_008500 [Diacronema lutheri]|uniref:PNPLA domain-containing protein n=1 Tax=Diacronema lutheri TaxID=2081491 RepID=A0A8J6CEW6_DIALT|nr:hypothetical protein KFE25_008500 [Diacronema lutheri]